MWNTKISIISMLFVFIAASSFAGVWEDNFDDGNDDGWDIITGEWEVKDGVYEQSIMEAAYQKSILEFGDLADYTLDVDIAIFDNSDASTSIAGGVLVRTDSEGNSGYRFWGRPDQHGFQFSVWQENTFAHVITDAAAKAVMEEVYHLKIQMEGPIMSAWFNDVLVVDEYEDVENLFESGHIGLINYNSLCQYDNLTINGSDVPSSAVTPGSKLASAWGAIKTY